MTQMTTTERIKPLIATALGVFVIGTTSAYILVGDVWHCFESGEVLPYSLLIGFMVSFALGLLSSATLCESHDEKQIIIAGSLLVVSPFFVGAFINQPIIPMLLLIASFCGFGLLFPIICAKGFGWTHNHLPAAIGVVLFIFFSSGAFFAFLQQFLQIALGNEALFVLGIIYSLCLFITYFWLQRSPTETTERALRYRGENIPSNPLALALSMLSPKQRRTDSTTRMLLTITFITFLAGIAILPILVNASSLWQGHRLADADLGGGGIIPLKIAMRAITEGEMLLWIVTLSPALGALSWGLFMQNAENDVEKPRMLVICATLATVVIFSLLFVGNFYAFSVMLLLLGFCWGGFICITIAMALRNCFHEEMTWVIGLLMGVSVIAAIVSVIFFDSLPKVTARFLVDSPYNPAFKPLAIVNPDVVYLVTLALCLFLLLVVFLWKNYKENRKNKILVS
ncbi:MAG: hypothetical protein K9K75_00385 [Deltaproteobacteria bacterium]|nr:hypothetical protein [Deltaproteobacteria bacterium]